MSIVQQINGTIPRSTYHIVESNAPSLKDNLTRKCTQYCKIELKKNIYHICYPMQTTLAVFELYDYDEYKTGKFLSFIIFIKQNQNLCTRRITLSILQYTFLALCFCMQIKTCKCIYIHIGHAKE